MKRLADVRDGGYLSAMLIGDYASLSECLGKEFSRRKQRNTSYSLRAFARDLNLSPGNLSEVLQGKHGLSESAIDSVAERLTKKDKEKSFLRDLVLAEFSRNRKVRELAKARLKELRKEDAVRRLREDQFRVISDWYHGAILELIQLKDFRSDDEWIAGRLGISASIVSAALGRLKNLGMITQDAQNNWKAPPEAVNAFSDIPSRAIKKFHLQILSMHADSLNEDPMDEREFLSTFLAVPRSRLPELQRELNQFMTRFWQKIADDPKDELYSLSLQFCPVRPRRRERGTGG